MNNVRFLWVWRDIRLRGFPSSTRQDILRAADAAGLSFEQVVRNIQTGMRRAEPHPALARQEPNGPESL
jgi:hypothetical protein